MKKKNFRFRTLNMLLMLNEHIFNIFLILSPKKFFFFFLVRRVGWREGVGGVPCGEPGGMPTAFNRTGEGLGVGPYRISGARTQ